MTGGPGIRSRTLKKYCTDNRNAKIRKDDLTHRTVHGTKMTLPVGFLFPAERLATRRIHDCAVIHRERPCRFATAYGRQGGLFFRSIILFCD